jgi:hypothetical protein
MDGARLINSSISSGIKIKEICKYTDSVMICFTKALRFDIQLYKKQFRHFNTVGFVQFLANKTPETYDFFLKIRKNVILGGRNGNFDHKCNDHKDVVAKWDFQFLYFRWPKPTVINSLPVNSKLIF